MHELVTTHAAHSRARLQSYTTCQALSLPQLFLYGRCNYGQFAALNANSS